MLRVHSRGYTVIQNELILDDRLSWEARGIMAYLLSRPPGWILQKGDLIARSPAGREKIERILRELETAGYLIRWQEQGEGGRFLWRSEVFETTAAAAQWQIDNSDHKRVSRRRSINGFSVDGLTVDGLTVDGLTVHGKPVDIVITDLSTPDLVITDLSNTELTSDRAVSDVLLLPQENTGQTETLCPVEVLSDSSPDRTEKTKNVPPPRDLETASAPPKTACERSNHALTSTAKQDPDYLRFTAWLERLCMVTNANAGNRTDREWAWDHLKQNGFVVNDDFWQGNEAYAAQKIAQMRSEGRAIGVKGGKNYLLDREWETALERQRILQQGLDLGIDLTNPSNVKAAAVRAKNAATFEEMKKLREERRNAV